MNPPDDRIETVRRVKVPMMKKESQTDLETKQER